MHMAAMTFKSEQMILINLLVHLIELYIKGNTQWQNNAFLHPRKQFESA